MFYSYTGEYEMMAARMKDSVLSSNFLEKVDRKIRLRNINGVSETSQNVFKDSTIVQFCER